MGPNDPWSPNWRPDASGRRLASIRTMQRGAVLAGALYALVVALAIGLSSERLDFATMAAAVGLPGVALLGAGLAPATLGSWLEAAMGGLALAIGAPVAAVTSILIGGFVIGATAGHDLTAMILRAGVTTALGVAPVVALAAAIWVLALRRSTRTIRLV
jgi:hypothetical protein